MNDDELLDALGDALAAPDRPVPAEGLAAVRAQATGRPAPGDATSDGGGDRSSRRTVLVGSIAAAVGALAGVAATTAVSRDGGGSDDAAPPTRPVAFASIPAGATVAGRTIDHTWGMELLLDVRGLPTDRDFVVSYATADGAVSAGGFRSVAVPMACRFNGTARRDAVTEIIVADVATGEVVLSGRPA